MAVNEEAERAVLGSCLLDSGRVIQLCHDNGLTPESFSNPAHARIFSAMLSVDPMRLDSLLLADTLHSTSALGSVGGEAYIQGLVESTPTAAHAEYYIDIVRKDWLLRKIASVSVSFHSRADSGEESADELLGDLRQKVESLYTVAPKDSRSLTQIADDAIEHVLHGNVNRIPWPTMKLQKEIGPLEDEAVWLCGQESMGKTAFSLQWLLFLAEQKKRCSMKTLETKKKRLVPRMVQSLGEFNWLDLKFKKRSYDEMKEAVELGKSRLSACQEYLVIDDRPSTMSQLRAWAQQEVAKGAEILFVDNMRHIRDDRRFSNQIERYAELSLKLVQLNQDVGVPLVVLHHLNYADKVDVGWAKDIKKDADILIFMTLDEELSRPKNLRTGAHALTVVNHEIKKNRDGEKDFAVQSWFHKEVQLFKSVEEMEMFG